MYNDIQFVYFSNGLELSSLLLDLLLTSYLSELLIVPITPVEHPNQRLSRTKYRPHGQLQLISRTLALGNRSPVSDSEMPTFPPHGGLYANGDSNSILGSGIRGANTGPI